MSQKAQREAANNFEAPKQRKSQFKPKKINFPGIRKVLRKSGYTHLSMITDTLQGSIWRASVKSNPNEKVVIKVTNKKLHSSSTSIISGYECTVQENILLEMNIQKFLTEMMTKDGECKCPDTITKYYGSFATNKNYYLIMEDGGDSLFDFVVKVHQFIQIGKLDIRHWIKTCKLIFKQMVDCIEYIHSRNIIHYDISLENFLINNADCIVHISPAGLETFEFDLA